MNKATTGAAKQDIAVLQFETLSHTQTKVRLRVSYFIPMTNVSSKESPNTDVIRDLESTSCTCGICISSPVFI